MSDDACTCGLIERIALETERTMHAAWRKRAEEAESALTAATKRAEVWEAEARAARARLTPLGFAVLTVGPEVGSHPHLSAYAAARARTDALLAEGEKKENGRE